MFSKIIIVFSAIVALTHSNPVDRDGGHSTSSRSQDDYGNYKFSYFITDNMGAKNSRQEIGDHSGNVIGFYTLNDIDGRSRVVHYNADKSGFRAKIKTNEMGTSNQDSADAVYNGIDSFHGSHQ